MGAAHAAVSQGKGDAQPATDPLPAFPGLGRCQLEPPAQDVVGLIGRHETQAGGGHCTAQEFHQAGLARRCLHRDRQPSQKGLAIRAQLRERPAGRDRGGHHRQQPRPQRPLCLQVHCPARGGDGRQRVFGAAGLVHQCSGLTVQLGDFAAQAAGHGLPVQDGQHMVVPPGRPPDVRDLHAAQDPGGSGHQPPVDFQGLPACLAIGANKPLRLAGARRHGHLQPLGQVGPRPVLGQGQGGGPAPSQQVAIRGIGQGRAIDPVRRLSVAERDGAGRQHQCQQDGQYPQWRVLPVTSSSSTQCRPRKRISPAFRVRA